MARPDRSLATELAHGFRVDAHMIPWGTTLGDAAQVAGLRRAKVSAGGGTIGLRSAEIFGVRTLSALLGGPAADRPVLGATYEVDARHLAPNRIVTALAERLGVPKEHEHHPGSDGGYAWASVVETARWDFEDTSIGVSVYGGERQEPEGRSIAMIWHSWDEEKAAAPFVAEWRSRSAALARCATRRSSFEIFELDLPQRALHIPEDANPIAEQLAAAERRRAAHFSLYDPDTLDTPAEIAELTPVQGLVLWSSDIDSIWCVSTRWDSASFVVGAPVKALHIEIKPAKGGGYAAIEIRRWAARASYPSEAIARAARMIAAMPGVTMEHHEGYDA